MSNKAFLPTDMVVWNGIITKFGVIEPLIDSHFDVRFATNEETLQYLEANINNSQL